MDKIKYIKIEDENGNLSDNIPIGADASNIDTADGNNMETKVNNLQNKVSSMETILSGITESTGPSVANSIEDMTDISKIYINTQDDNWYYYNNVNSQWEIGGSYPNENVTKILIDIAPLKIGYSYNYNNINLWENGNAEGGVQPKRLRTKDFLSNNVNIIQSINNYYFRVCKYTLEGDFIERVVPEGEKSDLITYYDAFNYTEFKYKLDIQYSNVALTKDLSIDDCVNIIMPYGKIEYHLENLIGTNSVEKQLLNSFIRTTYDLPNYNTDTKILTFPTLCQLYYDFNKYVVLDGQVNLNGINIALIYYDFDENKVKATSNTTKINSQNIIILGVINSLTGTGNLLCNYTVNKITRTETNVGVPFYFTVSVNQNFLPEEITDEVLDNENFADVNCVLYLPTNYSSVGKPSKLVFSAHGAGRSISDNYPGNLVDFYSTYTDNGYAVFDVNGSNQNNFQNMGSPRTIQAAKKAYDFIVSHFNVEDTIYLQGLSMGGLTVCNFANHFPSIVKCIALWSGCTNLYEQAWKNPWNTSGGEGTYPTKQCIAIEYNFNDNTGNTWEPEKVIGYNPYENAVKNIPIRIWHGTSDDAVSYQGSVDFIDRLRQNGCDASLRTIEDGEHNTNSTYYTETIRWFNRY